MNTSTLFFYSLHVFLYSVSFLIALSRPSLTSRLKIANMFLLFHDSAPVLWNSLPFDHNVAHRVTPSPTLISPASHLQHLFLLNSKSPSLSLYIL